MQFVSVKVHATKRKQIEILCMTLSKLVVELFDLTYSLT